MLNYRRNSTDVYIAHVHTHPTKANDPVYGCPPQATGPQRTRLARGPWDTSRRTAAKDPDINTGGGSKWGDWILVFNNRDEYVINADGEVWHLPKHLWFSDQRTNREFWNYTGNANAACNW